MDLLDDDVFALEACLAALEVTLPQAAAAIIPTQKDLSSADAKGLANTLTMYAPLSLPLSDRRAQRLSFDQFELPLSSTSSRNAVSSKYMFDFRLKTF